MVASLSLKNGPTTVSVQDHGILMLCLISMYLDAMFLPTSPLFSNPSYHHERRVDKCPTPLLPDWKGPPSPISADEVREMKEADKEAKRQLQVSQ
jgi:hypothetical protein